MALLFVTLSDSSPDRLCMVVAMTSVMDEFANAMFISDGVKPFRLKLVECGFRLVAETFCRLSRYPVCARCLRAGTDGGVTHE